MATISGVAVAYVKRSANLKKCFCTAKIVEFLVRRNLYSSDEGHGTSLRSSSTGSAVVNLLCGLSNFWSMLGSGRMGYNCLGSPRRVKAQEMHFQEVAPVHLWSWQLMETKRRVQSVGIPTQQWEI